MTLESRLIATWLRGPALRERWTPVASEQSTPRTQALAAACQALAARGTQTSDRGDVSLWLVDELTRSGALTRLWALRDLVLPDDTLQDPDEAVRQHRAMRTAFALRQRLLEESLAWAPSVDLADAQKRLYEAIRAASVDSPIKAYSDAELMGMALNAAGRKESPGAFSGLATVDRVTGGIRPGHVWVIGAPTNWGKSSLLLAVLDHAIDVHGARALLVTCEDSPEMLAGRLAARRCGIDGMAIRDGKSSADDMARISDELLRAKARGDGPVMLDGRGQTVEHIAHTVRTLVAQHGIMLVCVDYLQCMRSAVKQENRRLEINAIARTLTDAIKTSGAGGMLASQLTGDDIRDSRDVEHAAEVVLIGKRSDSGALSLFIKKNKSGPCDTTVQLAIDSRTGALVQVDGERSVNEVPAHDYDHWLPDA